MTQTGALATPGLGIRGLEMPWNRLLQETEDALPSAETSPALSLMHPQEFLAECVETVQERGDMMTFVFRRMDGASVAYRAGQYLNISFPVHGDDAEPLDRSYSFSSSPAQPWTFSITVKRDPVGVVSQWAHAHVRPGTVLDMLGPVGAFHLPDRDRRARYLMLAAGSGITPLMSMIRTIHAFPGKTDATLVYHAATPEEFAFAEELRYLAASDARIKVHLSLGDRGAPDDWIGMSGRLNAATLNTVAPDITGRQVFLCGPSGYLDTAVELLRDVGVDDTAINLEFFTGDSGCAGAATATDAPADATGAATTATDTTPATPATSASFVTVGSGSLTMSFVRSALNVRIEPGERILEVAKRAGVRIGANCREGMCGSCKSVKLEGEVEMHHQGGIRAREIEAGKFLPCCSTPLSNLIIDA